MPNKTIGLISGPARLNSISLARQKYMQIEPRPLEEKKAIRARTTVGHWEKAKANGGLAIAIGEQARAIVGLAIAIGIYKLGNLGDKWGHWGTRMVFGGQGIGSLEKSKVTGGQVRAIGGLAITIGR
jgi:hypothetical protein